MIDDEMIHSIGDREEENSAIARLIEIGRQKSFVTIDDILIFFRKLKQMLINLKRLSPLY